MIDKNKIIKDALGEFYVNDISSLQALVAPNFTFSSKLIKNMDVIECYEYLANLSNYAMPNLNHIVKVNDQSYIAHVNMEFVACDIDFVDEIPIKAWFEFEGDKIKRIEINYEFKLEYLKLMHKVISGLYLPRCRDKIMRGIQRLAV